jgi:hypothetical protein
MHYAMPGFTLTAAAQGRAGGTTRRDAPRGVWTFPWGGEGVVIVLRIRYSSVRFFFMWVPSTYKDLYLYLRDGWHERARLLPTGLCGLGLFAYARTGERINHAETFAHFLSFCLSALM